MNTVVATVIWLNLATFDYSLSLPTRNYNECRTAMMEYANSNLDITFLSCDRKPLPNAVNTKRRTR